MANEEVIQQSFAAGELSPQMYGRYELAVVKSGCRRMRNFISETQGDARFRNGFRMVHNTRLNKVPALRLFQFNDEQAYQLEFTSNKLRFYKDEGIVLESDINLSTITQASPGVFATGAAHGLTSGQEIYFDDVQGMVELNGNSYLVVVTGATTFTLTDLDGNAISTLNFSLYTAGTGHVNRIYEITTPYDEGYDLSLLKVTQNADTMYIDHPFFEPRKLTRTAHTSWTLSLYTRTSDPFLDKKVITGVTAANPGVVTSVGHGLVTDDVIIIEGIVGMTELNSRVYKVVKINNDTFSLKAYLTGTAVDTSAYTAYSSAGYASKTELLPSCLCFHEGRLYHAGMEINPTQFIGSMSPNPTTGDPRYDDYTAGADPDDAVYFSIADSEVNHIQWMCSTNRLLMIGTFGSEVKVTGETVDKPITPSSVLVRPENRLGVADISPINKENVVIYVQRGNLTLRSFEFDALDERFISEDRNLIAQHITKSGLKDICWITGRPDLVWAVRNDGLLAGLTFKPKDEVPGWHLHETGAAYGDKILSVSPMPRPLNHDQLWVVTERIVDGSTRRFVEFMTDEPDFPAFADFYTGVDNYDDDLERWALAMIEEQKQAVHLDCSLTYDGSDLGTNVSSSITPSAVTGDSIVITSDVDVFTDAHIGREIWKKSSEDGEGYGRALILSRPDAQHVVCQVLVDFDSVDEIAYGDWYMTTSRLISLDHLEGRTIQVVTDGGAHPDCLVTDGAIDLEYEASVVHVGLGYTGMLEPVTVEGGGTTGPAQGKSRTINHVDVRFLNSVGAEVGTNHYRPETVSFETMPLRIGSGQVLFTGVKEIPLGDSWDVDKTVYVRQDTPLPCTVQFLECWVDTDNG